MNLPEEIIGRARVSRGASKLPDWRGRIQIDAADLQLLIGHKLMLSGGCRGAYGITATCCATGKRTGLARLLMGCPDGMVVDHINGDKFDNRRANLRICTQAENCRNKASHRGTASLFKGVYWISRERVWGASIRAAGQRHFLGNHATDEAAARAYDAKARELHGEFARLNFPLEQAA